MAMASKRERLKNLRGASEPEGDSEEGKQGNQENYKN